MNDIIKKMRLLEEDGSTIFIENNERKNEITVFIYYDHEDRFQRCATFYIVTALIKIGYTITHFSQGLLAFHVTEKDRKNIKSKIKQAKEEVTFS